MWAVWLDQTVQIDRPELWAFTTAAYPDPILSSIEYVLMQSSGAVGVTFDIQSL